jgi:mannose/cellobiose epimerase-like protein (N-acyl-D-glucosamine 2-epimerase family)
MMRWKALLEATVLAAILAIVMGPRADMDWSQCTYLAVMIALGFVGGRNRFAELYEECRRLRARPGYVVIKKNGVWVRRDDE